MKFSVFVPVRNGGHLIRRCVASILDQSHGDLTLTVLDNASADGTPEWLTTLSDERVRVRRSTTALDIGASWERILDEPKHEFMTIVGHDDILDRDFLSTITALAYERPDAGIYHTHFRIIDVNGVPLRRCRPNPPEETAAGFLESRLRFDRDSFGTGYVFRSGTYDAIGGIPPFPALLYADDALWIRLMRDGPKITAPEELFSYRQHAASTTCQTPPETSLDGLVSFTTFLASEARHNLTLREVVESDFTTHVGSLVQSYFTRVRRHHASLSEQREARERVRRSVSEMEAVLGDAGIMPVNLRRNVERNALSSRAYIKSRARGAWSRLSRALRTSSA